MRVHVQAVKTRVRMNMHAKVFRPVKGRVEFWTPYRHDNRNWIKHTFHARPERSSDGKWLVARHHFMMLVQKAAERYGKCEVWMDFNSKERCHVSCKTARGDECVCSCLGKYHKDGNLFDGWTELGDGVLVSDDVIRTHWVVVVTAKANAWWEGEGEGEEFGYL